MIGTISVQINMNSTFFRLTSETYSYNKSIDGSYLKAKSTKKDVMKIVIFMSNFVYSIVFE